VSGCMGESACLQRERERKKEREYCVHKEIGTKKQKKKGGDKERTHPEMPPEMQTPCFDDM